MYASAALIDIESSQDLVWLAFVGCSEESPDYSPTLIHTTQGHIGHGQI